jgi:hypothetical protein
VGTTEVAGILELPEGAYVAAPRREHGQSGYTGTGQNAHGRELRANVRPCDPHWSGGPERRFA